jgi:hypothetical protein
MPISPFWVYSGKKKGSGSAKVAGNRELTVTFFAVSDLESLRRNNTKIPHGSWLFSS